MSGDLGTGTVNGPAGSGMRRQAGGAEDQRAAALGRVLALLTASPRHRNMTLAEIDAFVGPAIVHGQLAMLAVHAGDGKAPLAAALWWALVSEDVCRRLSASRDAHLKLGAGDWQSGDQPWIVEMVGERRALNELIKRVSGKAFQARPAKLRAVLPDGRFAVGRLAPRPDSEKTGE